MSTERFGAGRFRLVLAVTLLVQFVLTAHSYPLSELWTETPQFFIDGAAHWYRLKTAVGLSETGVVNGYDPFFQAGRIAGIRKNLPVKLPAVAAVLASPAISEVVVWKLYAFAVSVFAPLCVPLALRGFRVHTPAIATGAALGLGLWWISLLRLLYVDGLVSFAFAAYLALPYVALVWRYLNGGGGWGHAVTLSVLGAACLFVHPLFPIPVLLATLAFLVAVRHILTPRRVLVVLLVVPLVSVAANWHWLSPVLTTNPLSPRPVIGHLSTADATLPWREVLGLREGNAHGSPLYGLVALGTIASLGVWRQRRLAWALAMCGTALIVLAALGSHAHVIARLTQPNRFAPVGYLVLGIPAAAGVVGLVDVLRRSTSRMTRVATGGILTVMAGLALVAIMELVREVSTDDDPVLSGRHGRPPPLVRGLGPHSDFVLRWLHEHTTPAARVLFETSDASVYDGAHMAGYYAWAADREFIGGSYPLPGYLNFRDGRLFERPIGELGTAEFLDHLERYNIGWIIAHSQPAKRYLGQIPSVVATDTFLTLKTYVVRRRLSFFAAGSGRIEARTHNRLILSDLRGEAIVVKYHYTRGLSSDPPARIEPAILPGLRRPFIRIVDPPPRVHLSVP